MENTRKQKFEEHWREAFDSAGVQPSENLWEGIETQLDHVEKGVMRKRVVYYQRLAAACILFSLVAGGFGLYWRNEHQTQLANVNQSTENNDNKAIDQNKIDSMPLAKQNDKESSLTTVQDAVVKNHQTTSNSKTFSSIRNTSRPNNALQNLATDNDIVLNFNKVNSISPLDSTSNSFKRVESIDGAKELSHSYSYNSEAIEAAPLFTVGLKGGPINVELIRKLPAMPSVFMDRAKEQYGEKWWASAGASAGAYSPNFNTSSPAMSSAYQSGGTLAIPSSVPANYGSSYSVALTAAHRISRRWVLQSGMQYMARSIDYTSNYVSYAGAKSSASLADYASLNTNAVAVTSPYQLESRSEYISIPLQAGYLLVDRKFGVLLNSGVSSDIFIRNTLTDLSGQRESYSENAGQNSPYRTFMWSALMSTELSYKMGPHYRIALVPGIRYSFNQVLKSDQSMQGNPMIWDVGFRFRYIFK